MRKPFFINSIYLHRKEEFWLKVQFSDKNNMVQALEYMWPQWPQQPQCPQWPWQPHVGTFYFISAFNHIFEFTIFSTKILRGQSLGSFHTLEKRRTCVFDSISQCWMKNDPLKKWALMYSTYFICTYIEHPRKYFFDSFE